MVERVLLVDDEEPLLKAYRRFLEPAAGATISGRRAFDVETLSSPDDALEHIADHGPFAVVVSDYKMPRLDGVRFLERVKSIAPDTVRVMLTGDSDIATAIDSVNCGAVFRFLTKPCLPATLSETVSAALRQHQLIVAERQLLEDTVSGVVRVLMDTLTLVNPTVSNRAYRVRRCARHIVRTLRLPDPWQHEVAAMLSQFGCVVLGTEATTADAVDHPALAQELLGHIPRFEEVAAIIGRQADGLEPGEAAVPFGERDRVRLGGQILHAALAFEAATSRGRSAEEAIAALVRQPDIDPGLVRCLVDVDADLRALTPRVLPISRLRAGMVLDEDLKGANGVMIMARAQEVTDAMRARLLRMASTDWLRTPVRVLVSQVTEFEPLPRRPTAPIASAPEAAP